MFACLCTGRAGTLKDDSIYIFNKILEASSGTDDNIVFNYHLGSVPVCRDAFFQFLGLHTRSTRALAFETKIRQGCSALPPRKKNHTIYGNDMQDLCRQYIHAFVVVHSEKSPSHPIFVLEKQYLKDVFQEYEDYFQKKFCVTAKTFKKLWYQQHLNLPSNT